MTPPGARPSESPVEKLQTLVQALIQSNPFYAAKLGATGIGQSPRSVAEFNARFPFTTKAELIEDQKQTPPFGSNLTFPVEQYSRFHQTSGTSGQPMRWLDTPESWDWVVDCWTRIFQTAGIGRGERVAGMLPPGSPATMIVFTLPRVRSIFSSPATSARCSA